MVCNLGKYAYSLSRQELDEKINTLLIVSIKNESVARRQLTKTSYMHPHLEILADFLINVNENKMSHA